MNLRLIDVIEDHRRRGYHNHNVARTLTKEVRIYLTVNICRRTEAASEEIGACLENPKGTKSDLQEKYWILKQWHQHASGWKPQPYCTDLEKVLRE